MKTRSILLLFLVFFTSLIFAQWTNDPKLNTLIRDTTGDQVLSKLAINQQTGTGYISWFSDMSDLQFDVNMNVIDKDGYLLWGHDGLQVSDNPSMTWVTDYGLMIDDDNCALLTTQDIRTGTSNVFAYRINSDGDFLWGDDGLQLTNNTNFNPSPNIIQDHNGDYIIGWTENYTIFSPTDTVNKSYIRFQKVKKDGTSPWDSAMVVINDTINYMFLNFNFVLKPDNGYYMTFIGIYITDSVMPGQHSYMNIYVQNFDTNGDPLWDHPVSLEPDYHLSDDFYIYGDAYHHQDGGIIILWQSADPWATVKMQHLDQDGNKLCGDWGTKVSNNPDHQQQDFATAYDADNDFVYVFWQDLYYDPYNPTYCSGILGQKFSADGTRLWSDTGSVFSPYICAPDTAQWPGGVATHPEGGAMAIYTVQYLTITGPDTVINNFIYATRADPDGEFEWDQESIVVSDIVSSKGYYVLSEYTNGEWIASWSDSRNDLSSNNVGGIYAQNIIEDGTLGPLFISNPAAINHNELNVYPNPFSFETTITFNLKATNNVSCKLYNNKGSLVKTIPPGLFRRGNNKITVSRDSLPSGVYHILLTTGNSVISKKVIIY
ncbi:MAG: T9SS type A sorting domain-containing protein [Bacteroidetes bacterium]|nr:T9SS type A sorting domain-containing protein [Bacteroidota bacterium]